MTCGINLGILLICSLQAVHVCHSRVLQVGAGSRTDHTNSPVGLSHVHGRFEGSRPQDEFRQAYVVKSSSKDQRLYNQQYTHTASQANPVKYSQSSQTNHKGHNMDPTFGNVPPKNPFGLSSSIASGSSVSKQGSPNQHNGVLRKWPGQQGAHRTSQYTYSKPDGHSSKHLLSQSDSHQLTGWKPLSAAKAPQKPGLVKNAQGLTGDLTPPKEYVQATSGLSHGRKVSGGARKTPYRRIQTNPLALLQDSPQLPNSWQFGLQSPKGSDHNQTPKLILIQPGYVSSPELQSGILGPGKRFASSRIYNIPWHFGGHPIKRLGAEEPVVQPSTTQMPRKPVTQPPAKTYTFRPRHTESYRPRQQSVYQKSKWMRIRSNQLTGDGEHCEI